MCIRDSIYRGANISTLSDPTLTATSLDADDTVTIATSPQTGTLPTGISLSNTGTLSGTVGSPSAGFATHTFTLRATAESGVESITADSPTYTLVTKGTRVTDVSPTTFGGESGSTFTITGHGFNGSPAVRAAGSGEGVKFVGTGTGNTFTQNAASITVDSDTQLTVTTSADITSIDAGDGLDIVVKLVGISDEFKLSDDSNSTRIAAPAGITAGTPTTLTNTITSALRGQALTGTDFVIPAASDSNGTIASYALNTAFSASTGLSSDANWLSFNPSNRQITGNVPASYIAGGGSITVPIRITDNAGNILDQDYTITVDGQGFSYPLGISHSAMFDGSSSLSRSPSTIINSSQTTWTWSMWMKRSKLGIGNMRIFGVATGSTQTEINVDQDDRMFIYTDNGLNYYRYDERKLRDMSAWYHLSLIHI